MAAAAAVTGKLTDVRELELWDATPAAGGASAASAGRRREPRPGSALHRRMYAEAVESAGPIIRESGGGSGEAKGMPAFVNLKGKAAPLPLQNIDTDMIIPKEFLKTTKRHGLGFAAFAELRYHNPVTRARHTRGIPPRASRRTFPEPSRRSTSRARALPTAWRRRSSTLCSTGRSTGSGRGATASAQRS